MAGYYPSSCDNSVPDHLCNRCGVVEHGRILSAAFISNDFDILDYSNPTEWIAGINAGKIKVIPDVRGEKPKGSPVLVDGYGRLKQRMIGYDFTASITDPSLIGNYDFYASLVGSTNYRLAFCTDTQVYVTSEPVTIIPDFIVTVDLNSEVTWTVDFQWSSPKPIPFFNMPEGVFECFFPA